MTTETSTSKWLGFLVWFLLVGGVTAFLLVYSGSPTTKVRTSPKNVIADIQCSANETGVVQAGFTLNEPSRVRIAIEGTEGTYRVTMGRPSALPIAPPTASTPKRYAPVKLKQLLLTLPGADPIDQVLFRVGTYLVQIESTLPNLPIPASSQFRVHIVGTPERELRTGN